MLAHSDSSDPIHDSPADYIVVCRRAGPIRRLVQILREKPAG